MRPVVRPAILALLLAVPAVAQNPPAAPAPTHVPFVEGRPFAEVMKRAKAEKKVILLDIVASWCGPCKLMDKTTFADPDVTQWAKKVAVPARVDAEKGEGRKLAYRYAIR